jgi:XTP/dITP diphosphohydrolase
MRRIARGSRLVLATHNAGKLNEIKAMLAPCGVTVDSAGALGLPEPEETASDFAGNAKLKAKAAAICGLPALADDSGFCVAALGGAPGVLSARWAGADKDFDHAMHRVWEGIAGATDLRAWFVCALCLAWPDGETATFFGRAEGRVIWPPRGSRGFGYDPMFASAGRQMTYGEMEPGEKHAISHRSIAMAQLLASCFDTVS